MKTNPCPREDELLDALSRGYVDSELVAHLETCRSSCNELHTVAGALLSERDHAISEAAVPAAGTMWWRMQIRHRHDAEATARRSLLVGHVVTLVVATGLIVSLPGTDFAGGLHHVIASIRLSTPLLVALATWIVLAPIAGYVAIRQK